LADINELKVVLHLNHVLSVFEQVFTEVLFQNEEFFVDVVFGGGSVLAFDHFLPLSHELPLLELLEEWEFFDVVV